MDKNKLNNAFNALAPSGEASERMLKTIQKRPQREGNPFVRFAAVAAALCMFAVMGYFTWQYAISGETPFGPAGPGIAEVLHTEFMPYGAAPAPAEYMIFRWGVSLSSYTPQSPMIIESEQDMELFGFWSGISMTPVSSVPPQELPSVDYEKKAVIAVWDGSGDTNNRYDAPLVAVTDDSITIIRRMTADTAGYDGLLRRGYFIILDRDMIGNREIIYDTSLKPEDETDATPEHLLDSGIRVLSFAGHGNALELPGLALRKFDGWSWTLHMSGDESYIIYPGHRGFGPDSGPYRSFIELEFLDGSGRMWTSEHYCQKDLRLEPLGGDRWAVYETEPMFSSYRSFETNLLAILTVKPDGVQAEVTHEDGMRLVGSCDCCIPAPEVPPSLSDGMEGQREPLPYEAGTVRIVSGGVEHEPYVNFVHSYQLTEHGGLFGDGIRLYFNNGELFDTVRNTAVELPAVLYADDFEIVIEGDDASKHVYSVFLKDEQQLRHWSESFDLPAAEGEYYLCIELTWSNNDIDQYREYSGFEYWFKIIIGG
jgi:hypothetical protein